MPSCLPTYLLACFLSFLPFVIVPWVRRLVAGPSPPRRTGFNLRPSHLGFAVTAMALVQTFLQIFYVSRRHCHSTNAPFSNSPICHRCCMLLTINSVVTKNTFNFIPNKWLKRQGENAAALYGKYCGVWPLYSPPVYKKSYKPEDKQTVIPFRDVILFPHFYLLHVNIWRLHDASVGSAHV
jgi:hypothetical protein